MQRKDIIRKILKTSILSAVALGSGFVMASPQVWFESVKIAGTAEGCEPADVGASSWDKTVSFATPYFDLWLGSEDRIERRN